MRLPLDDVRLEMAMAMAIDAGELEAAIDRGLQDDTTRCLAGAVRALNVTLFNATVGGFGDAQVSKWRWNPPPRWGVPGWACDTPANRPDPLARGKAGIYFAILLLIPRCPS
jgi:hypothetical protein